MIAILGVGFRYFEIGVIAAVLVLTGILFVRRRPPGLVWVSVAAMGGLLSHLYIEEGRWQLVPVYAVVFVFSIWIAIPGKKAVGAAGRAFRLLLIVFPVIPALLVPLAVPLFVVPSPTGPYGVGVATLHMSPADTPSENTNLSVTIRYPRDQISYGIEAVLAPYWSLRDVESNRLPGLPWFSSTHLTLVPTNSVLRGPIADGRFPGAIAVRSPTSLPSDFVTLVEEIASFGWIVVEVTAEVSTTRIVWLLSELELDMLDSAFVGFADTNRAVILGLGWDPGFDLGLPTVHVGGEGLLSVATAGGSYVVALPDSRIPDDALTNRHFLVRPARWLVGSSDVSPIDISKVLNQTASALLSDGSLSAPVFAAGLAQSALTGARSALATFLPNLTIQVRPAGQ